MSRRLTIATTCAACAFLGAPAAALAGPAQSVDATIRTAQPEGGSISAEFTATRPADAPAGAATGRFDGRIKLGATYGGGTLMSFGGRITCLDVRAKSVSIFYPIDQSQPDLFARFAGVYLTVQLDGRGKAKKIGFMPVPFKSARSGCSPLPGMLNAEGPVTATR